MTTLRDIPVGSSCTVKALTGTGAIKRRIMDMGITKGAKITVVKVAPLGDPLELNVRGYELSIRKDEAEKVEVEPASARRLAAAAAPRLGMSEGRGLMGTSAPN